MDDVWYHYSNYNWITRTYTYTADRDTYTGRIHHTGLIYSFYNLILAHYNIISATYYYIFWWFVVKFVRRGSWLVTFGTSRGVPPPWGTTGTPVMSPLRAVERTRTHTHLTLRVCTWWHVFIHCGTSGYTCTYMCVRMCAYTYTCNYIVYVYTYIWEYCLLICIFRGGIVIDVYVCIFPGGKLWFEGWLVERTHTECLALTLSTDGQILNRRTDFPTWQQVFCWDYTHSSSLFTGAC